MLLDNSDDYTAFASALATGADAINLQPNEMAALLGILIAAKAAALSPAQVAFVASVAYNETNGQMVPFGEHGTDDYFARRYAPATATGAAIGNTAAADAYRYIGRGYLWARGRTVYQAASDALGEISGAAIIDSPLLMMEPDVAASALVKGLVSGWIVGGKTLATYLGAGEGTFAQFDAATALVAGVGFSASFINEAMQFQSALAAGKWGVGTEEAQ